MRSKVIFLVGMSFGILGFFSFVAQASADYCADSRRLDSFSCVSYQYGPDQGCKPSYSERTFTCTGDPSSCYTTTGHCSSDDEAKCRARSYGNCAMIFTDCTPAQCWVIGNPTPTPAGGGGGGPLCGNGTCDFSNGEDCASCSQDCGVCGPSEELRVSGIVYDCNGTTPLSGVSVRLEDTPDSLKQTNSTGGDGKFYLTSGGSWIQSGDFRVEAPSGYTTIGPQAARFPWPHLHVISPKNRLCD